MSRNTPPDEARMIALVTSGVAVAVAAGYAFSSPRCVQPRVFASSLLYLRVRFVHLVSVRCVWLCGS